MTVPYRLHPNRAESSCSLKSTRERVSLIDKNRIESSYERPPLDTGEDRAEISNCRRLFNAAFKSAAEDTFVNEFFVRFEPTPGKTLSETRTGSRSARRSIQTLRAATSDLALISSALSSNADFRGSIFCEPSGRFCRVRLPAQSLP